MERTLCSGVDGSPESLAAARWAAEEAVLRDARLHLIHAGGQGPKGPAGAIARRRARQILDEAEEQVRSVCPSVRLTDEHAEGPATAALLRAGDDAVMMVLGSRGLSAVTGLFVGSVAQGVVARATRPAVLVRVAERQPDGAVVLGIDVTEPCDEVIEFAFSSALVRRAPLHVVHAWSDPSPASIGPGEIALAEQPKQVQEWEGFVDAVLQPWRLKHPDVAVTETVEKGRSAPMLLDAAAGAGLLVVGRRVRERPRIGPQTGPVTHHVIHHATCPVAVVPHL
ncbi:universal stress protein [Streptomyces lasiicapitis]|uniref:Universal stress protein n=1 Tax=Streptomyces lasiicapitis TaxID=1923961 RepID=A0ABQ2LQ97_9ACTN|nr:MULTISPECIES: universal stress protein [Streptomyces]QIB47486.1 universal stress protein [Streptomyces aureoverticillatus]GGO41827.1 universal stress protein [Streptomyces lasiicapitis]